MTRRRSTELGRFGGTIHRIFVWWIGEITATVPSPFRRLFAPSERAIVIEVANGSVSIRRLVRDRSETLGEIDVSGGDVAVQRAAIAELLGRSKGARGRLVLRLNDERILRQVIDLPAAAEENLRGVVTYQLDRETPFKPDEVYFDCRPTWRRPETGRMGVAMVVTPRSVVTAAVDRARGWGLAPDIVTFAGDSGRVGQSFNLMPGPDKAPRRRRRAGVNAALAVLAALLVAALAYLPLERDRRVAHRLEAQVATARANANAVQRLEADLDAALKRRDFIANKKREGVPLTRVINELTHLLPDDTWIHQFQSNGTKVKIVGLSPSASSLIPLIENSGFFRSASSLSPVTRDPRTGLERFRLAFEISPRNSR